MFFWLINSPCLDAELQLEKYSVSEEHSYSTRACSKAGFGSEVQIKLSKVN